MMLTNVLQKIQSAIAPQDTHLDLGWMDTLSGMSELDFLMETNNQLIKIDFSDSEHIKNKIEAVLKIDEKTYRNVKKITHNYLTSLKISKKTSGQIQATVYEFQRQLHVAYMRFFELYQEHGQVQEKFSAKEINLILARLLNATFIAAKWRYFDDQPAPVGTWNNVHKVIKTAENLAVMNTNLFLYDFQIKETSIATILKRGFMMNTLQKGNFSRLQIQLTEQVLKIWASNPLIVNKYKQDRHQFFIALENDRGPERVREIEKFAECRYWKTTRLIDMIEAYLCAVDTQKPLRYYGLEKLASTAVIVKLFKKLRTEWCVEGYTRQRRREVRKKNNRLLNVSHGLLNICHRLEILQAKKIHRQPMADSFQFDLKVAMHNRGQVFSVKSPNAIGEQNWLLVDESSSGFAVDLGKERSDWIETGVMVGYTTPEDKETLLLAEIKSVRKQADGTYRVGLELITKNALALQIALVPRDGEAHLLADFDVHYDDVDISLTALKAFSGLYIKVDEKDPDGTASLIIPIGEYKRGGYYHINLDGEDRIIMTGRILATHRDWVRVDIGR